MAKHIFSGVIDTDGDFVLLGTAIDYTLVQDKTYTIQCLHPTILRLDDDVDGGNIIKNPDVMTYFTYDGSTDLYVKTNGKSTVIVSES